jgi:hypothetical protein
VIQGIQKKLSVRGLSEDGLLLVSPRCDVIDGVGVFFGTSMQLSVISIPILPSWRRRYIVFWVSRNKSSVFSQLMLLLCPSFKHFEDMPC